MGKMWPIAALVVAVFAWFAGSAAGQADLPVTELPLSTKGAASAEVSFGDLASDALCQVSGAGIALVPAVALKDGVINPGPFDLTAVAALLQKPEETWAVSRLKGSQIRAALERSLSRLPLPNLAFLQVAGLVVTYDPEAPRDSRVKRVLVGGTELNEAETYEVAMPLSLAKGGAGYFQIFDASSIVRQGNQGLASIIFGFASEKGSVSYTGQGRIVAER
ncbi:MAG: 5'-nucleotidase C-terminal domain-containing protein [Armatimonadetes bacterium]|nr:5'-nucleotidase C-terminal domain-containing protein [Armatimonadota bacterium]